MDHQFGANDHLFGHYYQNYFEQAADYDPSNLLTYTSYFNTRYHSALLAETHTFTSNLLNNLVVSYQREVALRGGPPGSQNITSFGVKNIWQPTVGPYLQATITNYFGASSSAFAAWGATTTPSTTICTGSKAPTTSPSADTSRSANSM